MGQTRLDLRIDVFEEENQLAKALPDLKPSELVEAVLQEFRELEYLSGSSADYKLLRAEDGEPLDDEDELRHQIGENGRLIMVEEEKPLPPGTARPSRPIYLRDTVIGNVYKLHWLPAIIGRPDKNQPHNEWVAVDLERYKTGLRVSRRHAQISEENGQFFISAMSRNPTLVKDAAGDMVPVTGEKRPLHNGDIIHLERSNIALKFIIRE